jgi:hypothetical protein
VSGGSEQLAEEAVNNMEKQNMPKRSTVKKCKTGQHLSIESAFAFANAVYDPSDNSSNSSDDQRMTISHVQ